MLPPPRRSCRRLRSGPYALTRTWRRQENSGFKHYQNHSIPADEMFMREATPPANPQWNFPLSRPRLSVRSFDSVQARFQCQQSDNPPIINEFGSRSTAPTPIPLSKIIEGFQKLDGLDNGARLSGAA